MPLFSRNHASLARLRAPVLVSALSLAGGVFSFLTPPRQLVGQDLVRQLEFGYRGLAHAEAFMPVAVVLKGDHADRVLELRIDGDPSVRRRVELPRQTQKIIHLYTRLNALGVPGGRPLFRVFEGGKQLGAARRLDGVRARTIVPVVGGASWSFGRGVSSPVLDEALLPDRARGYDGISALVVYPGSWHRISRAAATAIATWVGRGGRLILPTVRGGTVLKLRESHPLGPLEALPAKTHLRFCRRLQRQVLNSEIMEAPWHWDSVTAASPPRQALVHLAAWKGGPPVLASTDFGQGHIAFLSFDPVAPRLRKWTGRRSTVGNILEQCLTTARPRFPAVVVPAGEAVPPAVDSWVFQQDESRRVLWPFVLFLIVYLALIGPADYLLVRRLGKPRLTWLTFSVVVVTFTYVAWSKGRERITRMEYREVSFIDYSEPGKPGIGRSFIGVYSDTNGSLSFRPRPPGGEVKPLGDSMNVEYTVDDRTEVLRQKLFIWAFHGYQVTWREPPLMATTLSRTDGGGVRLHTRHTLPREPSWVAFVHEGRAYQLDAGAFSRSGDLEWDLESSEHVTSLGSSYKLRHPGILPARAYIPERAAFESWLVVVLDEPWPALEIEGRTPVSLGQSVVRCKSFEVAK